MYFKGDVLRFCLFLLIITIHNVNSNVIQQNVTESDFIPEEPLNVINRAVVPPNATVTEIANAVIGFLGIQLNETHNPRLNELKSKLEKIDHYVIDKEKYESLLINEIKETNLTELNLNALKETDDFDFIKRNDYKHLYLKLKEKLNRDDVMAMLASGPMQKYAEKSPEGDLNVLVDKILGETPTDRHKYNISSITSIYWDPEPEIRLNRDDYREGRRLFKGETTTIRDFPFMAAVHVMGSFWCGGAIFWSDVVLTSAACLQLIHSNRYFRENARAVHVRVGSNHSLVNGELIEANEVYFHPSYNPRTLRNNIAIIRLSRHIHFSRHTVPKAIQISHFENNIPLTGKITLLGWGAISASGKMPYKPMFLKRLVLPVYPNWYCKEVYGDKFIAGQMFCAGTATTGEGACDHDAGGPAIMNGRLYGIISFGPSVCGYRDAPTVFTHVGVYADWIETINETIPSSARFFAKTTKTTLQPKIDSTPERPNPVSEAPPDVPIVSETPDASSTLQHEIRQRLVRVHPITKSNAYTLNGTWNVTTSPATTTLTTPPPLLVVNVTEKAVSIEPTPLMLPNEAAAAAMKTT